ncbi:hypothetical protein [Methylobacterium sp. ID0610]|uniref:hypothetical protein n=1 Tax=Methylobacterium carpenticola TaxID=3344827 RepID=UPI0036C34AFE
MASNAPDPGEVGGPDGTPLHARELDLVRQAVDEAFRQGADCEIEQAVRVRNRLSVRLRAQVRLQRHRDETISAVHIAFERDGEPAAAWTLTLENGRPDGVRTPGGPDPAAETINAFTAVILHAEAIKRDFHRSRLADMASSIESIIANTHRAWKHVSAFSRE